MEAEAEQEDVLGGELELASTGPMLPALEELEAQLRRWHFELAWREVELRCR